MSNPGSKGPDGELEESFELTASDLQKTLKFQLPTQKQSNISPPSKTQMGRRIKTLGTDQSNAANTISRLSDMSSSHFISNSSANRKVAYNIEQNSLRKLMMQDLDIQLSLLFLTGSVVSQMESDGCVEFDKNKEGFLVGSATLKFKLKDFSEDTPLYLDYCGDRLYKIVINGIEYPTDLVGWKNNQIVLKNLRKGSHIITLR